jgi:hypothetical protein
MNSMTRRSAGSRRPGRRALLGAAAAAAAAAMLLGGCSSSASSDQAAAQGGSAGTLELSPASGPVASQPTWSSSVACPNGYQGSGLFSELHSDGKTFTSISPVVNGTSTPFKGSLLASIALIKSIGAIPDGGSQKLFVICSSGPGGTGNTTNVMTVYISYSADGKSYSTSDRAPSGS